MKREEIEILEDVKLIEKRQGVLLEKAKSPQQELLQIFGQRHLLSKKMLHKNIEEVLTYQPGTFGNLVLTVSYMSLCLESRIELPPEHYPILKLLIDWTEVFPTFRSLKEVQLTDIVLQREEPLLLSTMEEYITYLNFIGADIVKVVRRAKGDNLDESLNSSTANVREVSDRYSFDHISPDNLLQFVNISLPKILVNVLLPNDSMPAEFRKQMQNMQCLYKNTSLQYFIRSKPQYSSLIKILFKILLGLELKANQQKQLMDIAFRYFYAFHHDKKYNATELFISTYNSLSEPTRFALSDEFILFFRIARKIGKGKFVDFLVDKSQWLKDITSKISEKSMIGYTKEGIQPYNPLGLGEDIVVGSGKMQTRSFQILEDYSLFYFRIVVASLDVTIRLFYLGDLNSPKPVRTLLFEHEKKSGALVTNVVAAKRGLYQFQFDNTYSWVNSKTVRYENIILTPVELQAVDRFKWISSYYDDTPSNEFANKDKLFILQKAPPKKEEVYTGTANITKDGPYYNLKITTSTQVYEFESENEERFIRKFNELVESAGNIKWMIAGEPIEDPETVQEFVSDTKKPAAAVSKPAEAVPPVKKQTIEVNYEEEEDEGESGEGRE